LGSAGLFSLLFTFVANPEIGFFRDWDVLSLPALPLTLWAGIVLIERAAALHTLAWIALNANQQTAVARYEHLMEGAVLSRHARSYGWDELGAYYRDQGDHRHSLEAYESALKANPQNRRHWEAVAKQHYRLERFSDAATACRHALDMASTADMWDLLGMTNKRLGLLEESIQAHAEAVRLDPDRGTRWHNLGMAHMVAGQLDEAIEALNAAIARRVAGPAVHYNLGLVREAKGNLSGAKSAFRRAVTLQADYAKAHYKLAQLYAHLGQADRAVLHARRFLAVEGKKSGAYAEEIRLLLERLESGD
jgi:tetratricopeptide (TPR) repeat protein